jgi:hypothetical protein
VPNQTHVQSVSSAETFAQLFTFLTGHDPRQTNVVAERGDQVTVAGRAVLFPYNSAVLVATLQVWELQAATGQHVGKKPLASITLGADGSWAPTRVKRGTPYEFAILRPGAPTQHFYLEPFRRSDYLIRLLTATPNGGLDTLVDKSDRHVSMVINRNKEFWGDEGMPQDALTVNGTNIVNSATAPISHRTNAIFVFDKGSDQQSDVNAALPAFFAQPFLSGVDLFVPAATPATGTVSVALTSRGGGPVRTVNFPNSPSTKDQVTVPLNDFE